MIKNIEIVPKPIIHTDHYPLSAEVCIKIVRRTTKIKNISSYRICNEEAREALNQNFKRKREEKFIFICYTYVQLSTHQHQFPPSTPSTTSRPSIQRIPQNTLKLVQIKLHSRVTFKKLISIK